MKKLLFLVFFLTAVGPGTSNTVVAGEECVFRPVVLQLSRSIFLPDTRVFCRDKPQDPVDQIAQAQAALTLCREMGGTQEVCNQVLLDSTGLPDVDVIEVIGTVMDREPVGDDLDSSTLSRSKRWMKITRLNPSPPMDK